MENKGQNKFQNQIQKNSEQDNFVLEKSIFSNIFEKDIRRVYIYKKAERLARAIHLIAPAFVHSAALASKADEIAIAIVNAAVLPPLSSRMTLSRELLALSSLLSMVRTGGLLSAMNADLISKEARDLLEEVASYEEPRLSFEHVPTLAELAKDSSRKSSVKDREHQKARPQSTTASIGHNKGHISDIPERGTRRESILSIIRSKGPSYIKDISTVIRDVSEKTIQRELQALVAEGALKKEGERRWTRYSVTS